MIRELVEGQNEIPVQSTAFTLDNMGRYFCNTLREALDSAAQPIAGHGRGFDVVIIGGGTFGSVVAERLFVADATHSRRILVLEHGPFVLPEHVQNMPFMGGDPAPYPPWASHPDLNYKGLIFAVGGRSLSWGGWSPELLDSEMTAWPPAARAELRDKYFAQASEQIGVTSTNDFIHGPLHTALRRQLRAGLKTAGNETGFTPADLLEHPAVRYHDPAFGTLTPAQRVALLREWLNLPATDTTPEAELLELFKLEAPLAVQSVTEPGLFPTNKFSAVPGLIRSARLANAQADDADRGARVGAARDAAGRVRANAEVDARKRLMVVPNCHVQELITETQADNWVRVTGVRVWQKNAPSIDVPLAPPRDGGQSAVVIALGTVETTRLALTTFQHSLAGRAAGRMGKNLVAHLRSNLAIRVRKESVENNLPPQQFKNLQCSALLVKGKASNGRTFHFQITASGLNQLGADSEAELFKKIPTLEHLEAMLRANDDTVVITIRGIGDMTPHNPDSFVNLSPDEKDFDRPKAVVSLGNARALASEFPGSPETNNDRKTWGEMDAVSDKIALIFAGDEPFEILPNAADTIPVPAGTRAERLAKLASFKNRRDPLGTTHHDAGTMRMGDNVADAVTNDYGRIHDTTNCYVAGPALFPTVGSPNPMLTGVALGRRTADLLGDFVLPAPGPIVSPRPEAGFRPLFNGTAATFNHWRLAGPQAGGMLFLNGEMVSYGGGGLRLFYYAAETFTDFTLRLQFRVFDLANHNSGVFLRFPRPTLPLTKDLQERLDKNPSLEPFFDKNNAAWKPVVAGYEVQIDDTARGATGAGDAFKFRTGAVYNVAAQNYTPGPALVTGVWFEYEMVVQGNDYTVFLTNTETGERRQTTSFNNTDGLRGLSPGFVGVQVYANSTVAWRHIRIKT